MDTGLVFASIVTVLLALVGYLITYAINVRTTQRKERLERIDRQLSELYGPLFALSHASAIAWGRFRSVYRPGGPFFGGRSDSPTEDELQVWRLWMTSVFMPHNLRMYELVITKADLLIEDEMPDCLLVLCAHVSAYEIVLKKWEANDFSEHTSLINFPVELGPYSLSSFRKLKVKQAKLLGNN